MLTDRASRRSTVQAGEIAHIPVEPDAAQSTVTCSQLEERAGRLAARLQATGAHPDDRIAMLAENDARIFDLQFACVRLGAAERDREGVTFGARQTCGNSAGRDRAARRHARLEARRLSGRLRSLPCSSPAQAQVGGVSKRTLSGSSRK
ncbi:AMP-binding protein [Actinomycetospora sp. C-140]